MPSFAKIDENNIVIQTITATYKFIRDGNVGAPSSWLEFSKTDPEKRRFPGIGWIYDPIEDNFFPPKPFPSWVWTKDENLNMEYWAPPIPFPELRKTDGLAGGTKSSGNGSKNRQDILIGI